MQLNEVLQALNGLTPAARMKLEEEALDATAHLRWIPNPGPQTEAYHSLADELYYGGEAGGGKTDLVLGTALNQHKRASIFREYKDDARSVGTRLVEILGTNAGWNEQQAIWRSGDQRFNFFGLPNEKDKEHHKGKARDFYGFDEIPDFTESQYLFVTAWCRSTDPDQRCRIVCTGNPPTRAKGLWVIKRWGAWLDERHPNPAKSGELRWYLRQDDDTEVEVDGPGPYMVDGKETRAKSRTFIRARLEDNPDLAQDGEYDATLAQLPKELRDAYRGGKFSASLKDHPFQVIPTAWVLDAQKRWTPAPPPGIPQCALGVDPAEGGKDRYTIVPRYDWWFDKPTCIPAKEIKLGSQGAGHVITVRRDNAVIVIDMGGGYGSATYSTLVANEITQIVAWKGANKSLKRTKDRKLGFANKRTEGYWLFREALDPDQPGGSPIALPPDPEIVSDLTAVTYAVGSHGIEAIPKEQVVKILGRSPDKGDSVVMCWSGGIHGLVPTQGAGQYGPEQYIAPANMRGRKLPSKADFGPRHRLRR
jgi:hypothetical protein